MESRSNVAIAHHSLRPHCGVADDVNLANALMFFLTHLKLRSLSSISGIDNNNLIHMSKISIPLGDLRNMIHIASYPLTLDLRVIAPLGLFCSLLIYLCVVNYVSVTKYISRNLRYPHGAPDDNGHRLQFDSAQTASDLEMYKEIYHKIHNWEHHLDIIPKARRNLIQLFLEVLESIPQGHDDGILSQSPSDLKTFIESRQNVVFNKLQTYIANRRKGGPRMMFVDL